MTPYRILVTGARELPLIEGSPGFAGRPGGAEWLIIRTLHNLTYWMNGPIVVVHGDCPTGVDRVVDKWAADRENCSPEPHPADWDRHGKAAGPIRNSEMVQLGANLCVGFPAAGSKGTWDCLRKAVDAGILIQVVVLGKGSTP